MRRHSRCPRCEQRADWRILQKRAQRYLRTGHDWARDSASRYSEDNEREQYDWVLGIGCLGREVLVIANGE